MMIVIKIVVAEMYVLSLKQIFNIYLRAKRYIGGTPRNIMNESIWKMTTHPNNDRW